MSINQKQKLVWKIDLKRAGNKKTFVFFCIWGGLAVIFLLQALVYAIAGLWKPQCMFLVAWPILFIVIDLFLGRKLLLKSQPDDEI